MKEGGGGICTFLLHIFFGGKLKSENRSLLAKKRLKEQRGKVGRQLFRGLDSFPAIRSGGWHFSEGCHSRKREGIEGA